MPRPKGSKNKPKTVKATVDFAAQLAEKQSAKEAAAAEIASIIANQKKRTIQFRPSMHQSNRNSTRHHPP